MCRIFIWGHSFCGHKTESRRVYCHRREGEGEDVEEYFIQTQSACRDCPASGAPRYRYHGKEGDLSTIIEIGGCCFDRAEACSHANQNKERNMYTKDDKSFESTLKDSNYRDLADIILDMTSLVVLADHRPAQVPPIYFSEHGPTIEQRNLVIQLRSMLQRNKTAQAAVLKTPIGKLRKWFLLGDESEPIEPNVLANLGIEEEYDHMIRRIMNPIPLSNLAKDRKDCEICMRDYGQVIPRNDNLVHRYERVELPVQLPCGHVFGRGCIEEWMGGARQSCPKCRRDYRQEIGRRARDAYEENMVTPWWLTVLRGW